MAVATIIPDSRSASEAASASGVYGFPSFSEYQDIIARQTAANNSWSAEQAQKQMDFQERMSSTAHQREVADLQAAGLNPVLSASHSGAQAMSGASANPDQSGNSALTTFLVNLIQSHTQMEMQRVSAENALAVAGMYNATSELVGSMSAAASRYGAAMSSAASRYGADKSLAATIYSQNEATLRQREQLAWQESHPQSMAQVVGSIVNQAAQAAGYKSSAEMVGSLFKNGFSSVASLFGHSGKF